MSTLTLSQYSLVYNAFSFVFATMFASFIYFVLARQQIAPQYRNALTMTALVVAVAAYHYFRIFDSWQNAFTISNSGITPSGKPFNDAYRYVDWLLTVPLLVAELVAVLGLARAKATNLTMRLAAAAALMVILGYPGEIASDNGTRLVWGILSTIPFIYIVFTLFTEMSSAIERQSPEVKNLFRITRMVLLITWGFYPIVYSLHYLGNFDANIILGVQLGYCIADVLAKAGYGLLIYQIARTKSELVEPAAVTPQTVTAKT